jgi:AcrR family transcriptional regulator
MELHHETEVLLQQLLDRAQAAGALRADIGMGGLQWLFMPTYAIQADDPERAMQLRHRSLAILLDGLHTAAATPLPGPPPEGGEYRAFWEERSAKAAASPGPPPSGRRAKAARDERHILTAARAVFMADPSAPIAAIAERAGVGVSVLYRRYPSKEILVQQVYLDGLNTALAELERALADPDEPRSVLRRFVHRMLQAGIGSMPYHFLGTFPISPEMARVSSELRRGFQELTLRTQAAGALRPDVGRADLESLFQPTYAIRAGDEERSAQLRHRFLAIMLDGLQTPTPSPLPGPPPEPEEFDAYWTAQLARSDRPDH